MCRDKAYNFKLICVKPEKNAVLKNNRNKLEKQIISLISENQPLSKTNEVKWLQLSMMYFHGVKVSLKSLKTLKLRQENENSMIILIYNEKEYWLPNIS